MRLPRFWAALWLVSLSAAPTAVAQLPGAKLKSIFPPGGTAGSELEVALEGSDLNAAQRLQFSHAGIVGEPVMAPADEFVQRPVWQRNRFKLRIGKEVPPGVYDAWFVGDYAISNPVTFVVGDLPQAAEAAGNNDPSSAATVALNAVQVGRVDAGKPDCFKITLLAGQTIVLECQAQRLGSRLDPVLEVKDLSGKRLSRARAAYARDPHLVFKAPADGDYVIAISDFLAAGGSDRFYRLSISDRPLITGIFPPAALPGSKGQHTVYGANLPGGVEKLAVEVQLPEAPSSVAGGFALRPSELSSAGGIFRLPGAAPLRIPHATAPVFVEDPAADVQSVLVPVEVAGHLLPAGDTDAFEFAAKKGERMFLEAISHRAGHGTDLHMTVLKVVTDAEGKRQESKVAEADDDGNNAGGRRAFVSSRDPLIDFTAPEDGRYVLRLFDQFNLDDPRASYRLSIRRPAPGFDLFVEIVNPIADGKKLGNWSASLLRGGEIELLVRAIRRDGFDGEISLEVNGLPAEIQIGGAKIGKGQNSTSLSLRGGAGLADWTGALRVVGRAPLPGGGELVRDGLGVTLVREIADFDKERVVSKLDREILFAGRAAGAPVGIELQGPQVIETSIGATVELPFKVAKAGAFKGATKFYPVGFANVKKRPEVSLDLNKVGEGKLSIPLKPSNENKYAPGSFSIKLRADAQFQHHPDPRGITVATEDKKAVDAALAAANESVKAAQAKRAEIEKAGLTEDEKAKQVAAAQAVLAAAQEKVKAANEAKKRAEATLKQANDRNRPRDVRIAAYSAPVTIKVAAAPLKLKEVPATVEVVASGQTELTVVVERLFGFGEAVELSLIAPEGVPGFDSKPVQVPKGQGAGKLVLAAKADAPVGQHAFSLLAKMNFNGVACELRQPITVNLTGAQAPPAAAGSPEPAPSP